MNGQTREKYLPIGSVVLLENGTKRVMINGFCTMDASNPDRVFDYSGTLFPEGALSSDQTLLFDHKQIVRIDHIGLEDQEEKEFKVKLNEIVANLNAAPAQQPVPAQPVVQPAPAQPAAPTPEVAKAPVQQPFTPVTDPTNPNGGVTTY